MYNTSQDTSSGSSSVLSTSPINKFDTNKYMKTSTPDIGYYNTVEPTMSNNNRLICLFKPFRHLYSLTNLYLFSNLILSVVWKLILFNIRCRLDGDGSDETEDPCLNLSEEMAKYGTPVSTNGVYSRQYYRPVHGMFSGNFLYLYLYNFSQSLR